MTTYKFPPKDKTLYGLTTGTVYKAVVGKVFPWEANGKFFVLNTLAHHEPDGVTDVPPVKVGDTVSAVEDLDALPSGTILREVSSGEAWQKESDRWFYHVWSMKEYNASAMSLMGAFTIVWLPETGDRA